MGRQATAAAAAPSMNVRACGVFDGEAACFSATAVDSAAEAIHRRRVKVALIRKGDLSNERRLMAAYIVVLFTESVYFLV